MIRATIENMKKIPDHAKKVFDGIIFDVYQWEQELFDGSTATFEALKRPNTVEVIPVLGDKIVLAEQEQPGKGKYMSLLGGRQDDDEAPLVTGQRELLEEAGIEASSWTEWKQYNLYGKMDWTMYLFIARECKVLHPPQLDPGERINPIEVRFDEFIEIATQETFMSKYLSCEILRMLHTGTIEQLKKALFN